MTFSRENSGRKNSKKKSEEKPKNGAAQAVKIQIAASIDDRRSERSACKTTEVYISIDRIHFPLSLSPLLPAILQERERSVTDHLNLINQVTESTLY